MKVLLKLSVLGLIFSSCFLTKNNNISTEILSKERKDKIEDFKIVFFKNCLKRGLGSTNIEKSLSKDISYSHDFLLGYSGYKLIDTLVSNVNKSIITDSVNWTNKICYNCTNEELKRARINGLIGKRTLKFCLDYYTSTELDSIARKRFSN